MGESRMARLASFLMICTALVCLGRWALPALGQGARGAVFRDCNECPEMIPLPAGRFAMGSPAAERGHESDEEPVHAVSVNAFAVGKLEITFAQWDACVAQSGCTHKPGDERWGRGAQPVINVSWDDTRQYTQWLSGKTGKSYRLLTEAEWEYAARAGTTARYYWGDDDSNACEYATLRTDWLGCGTRP